MPLSPREESNSGSDDSEDEDYVPPTEKPDVSEEEDSGDEETADTSQDQDEASGSGRKRKNRASDCDESSSKTSKKASTADEWAAFEAKSEELNSKLGAGTDEPQSKDSEPGKSSQSGPSTQPARAAFRGRVGGLKALAAKKEKKISVFEHSRQSWNAFKDSEGLQEELSQFTRSKDSFVERQAFLERTDVRQFEKEKSVRETNRRRQAPFGSGRAT